MDVTLAALDTFEKGDLTIHATEILTYSNCFKCMDSEAYIGNKSDKCHFNGYWELITVETKSEIIRIPPLTSLGHKHQILQMKELLAELPRHSHFNYNHILTDRIFDTYEIQQIILKDLQNLPMIKYNPKKFKYKRLKDLSNLNWRFLNPLLTNILAYYQKYNERTAVERFNRRLKDSTSIRRSSALSTIITNASISSIPYTNNNVNSSI
ncbi:MAG: transposase [Promethearchaeota archaeon]